MPIAANDRNFSNKGINQYVPKMTYAADMIHTQPAQFNLGSPAAGSATAIAAAVVANAVAGTVEAQAYVSDSRYGRSLIYTISGNPGNTNVVDVYGEDYLGQPMVERVSGASGVTAVIYGKKAFYRVLKTVVVTPATNAVTLGIGTGTRLGLPYKGNVAWAKEAGAFVNLGNRPTRISSKRAAADAVAGGSVFIYAPFPGYVDTLFGTPDGGGSTNDPVITVKLGGVAITGLTVTVDTSDTSGATVTDTPTTPGYNANNRFVTGQQIEIAGTAAASAKGDTLGLILVPTQAANPDTTDPQTVTSGDPRGTYEALATLNGATEIIVAMDGDASYNAAGNGGLHGIRHVIA